MIQKASITIIDNAVVCIALACVWLVCHGDGMRSELVLAP